ncbi:hypothetical protein V8E36_004363 [Tilletia maclaganii]
MRALNNGQNWVVALKSITQDDAFAIQETDPQAAHFHHCAGPIGQAGLEALAASGTVVGMPKKIGKIGFCSACIQGVPRRG